MNTLPTFYDLVVYGAGCVGFSAARRFSEEGLRVLMLEPSGDLLWECTRALENRRGVIDEEGYWSTWMEKLETRGAADHDWFDPAAAEVDAAEQAWSDSPETRWNTLLYAPIVGVQSDNDSLRSVIVATKGGWRTIHAARWIDASERGDLARRVLPASHGMRLPVAHLFSLVVHTLHEEAFDALLLSPFSSRCPDHRFGSVRSGERRLQWRLAPSEDPRPIVTSYLAELREKAGEDRFIVSHCSTQPYPIYASSGNSAQSTPPLPRNLLVASPAYCSAALHTPQERFHFGESLRLPRPRPALHIPTEPLPPPLPEVTLAPYEVVVAGGGTAGAIAALAAARQGVKTALLDLAPLPGGTGTLGMINYYFHGESGGLQEEVNEASKRLSCLLLGGQGAGAFWHHLAKAWALLDAYQECGVEWMGNAHLCEVERTPEGVVKALLAVVEGRLVRIPTRAAIDSTGDGDLCAMAGAPFRWGREGDGRALAYTQSALVLSQHDSSLRVRPMNYDAGWLNPNDPQDLTRARLIGIAQYQRSDWRHPGRPLFLAPLLGVRQSRQIETDDAVSLGDIVSHRRRESLFGSALVVMDTHSADYEFESDEAAFYYWTCRAFRAIHHFDLPYGMLVPKGLKNVWIACRASGMSVEAAYGLRMQREVQRFGEAAGLAAALAVKQAPKDHAADSRAISLHELQRQLRDSGSIAPAPTPPAEPLLEALLEKLDEGHGVLSLWHLYAWPDRRAAASALQSRLQSDNLRVAFLAASIMAMWNDPMAEPTLLRVIQAREPGPSPEEKTVRGAFGLCIDLPFWLQAVRFLRRIGTAAARPVLSELSERSCHLPFNAKTIIALAWEGVAERLDAADIPFESAIAPLLKPPHIDAFRPTYYSIWLALHGAPQKPRFTENEPPTSQDQTWQLHLVVARIARCLGRPVPQEISEAKWNEDPRGFVRLAFAKLQI